MIVWVTNMEITMRLNSAYEKCRGMTLIELLVVLSIIGVMASVILASLNDARTSAKYTVARQEMKQISDATLTINSSQNLWTLTGSNCSDCVCRYEYGGPADLKNLDQSHNCFTNWRSAITRIDAYSDYINGIEPLLRDPWGSPYLLDENEREWTSPNDCVNDVLRTAGPDGQTSTSDDYVIFIPLRTAACIGR